MDEIGRSIVAFNLMIQQIQQSSALLKQKTTDMQAMLQNMPQGILTITGGNRVHPEYSAYLETIFETKDIAGRDMMELVFSNTNLGADALSQVAAAASACIDEDAMNFAFNKHLLADEASKQKRELEIIGEILAITQEKFYEFITSSLKFVDENEGLIRENPEHNAEAINKLFRNMHTIKGNARTYGLRHLTNLIHEAEQAYAELRKPHPDIVWDQATLMDALFSVRIMLEHYASINEVSLGRKGPGRRGGVEHFLMVDKHQIQEAIQRLEHANTGNLHELPLCASA